MGYGVSQVWHSLHLRIGTFALCDWYRPGSGGAIAFTESGLIEIGCNVITIIVMRDCDVHHQIRTRILPEKHPKGFATNTTEDNLSKPTLFRRS